MEAFDSHAHLSDLGDQEPSIKKAREAGISGILAVSTTKKNMGETLRLAEENINYVYAALGIHPTEFFEQDLESSLDYIREHAKRIVAIGEIGLDYWNKLVRKNQGQKEKQREFYSRQLMLAEELNLPVCIHSRGAWEDCLSYALKQSPAAGVFHWYSGPLDVLSEILDSGFFVSCTPAVEYSKELRDAMSKTPLERILVETDSPVWIKSLSRPSEPLDVEMTVRQLATLKGLPEKDVAEITTRNVEKLFRI